MSLSSTVTGFVYSADQVSIGSAVMGTNGYTYTESTAASTYGSSATVQSYDAGTGAITVSVSSFFGPFTISGTVVGNDANDFLINGTVLGQPGYVLSPTALPASRETAARPSSRSNPPISSTRRPATAGAR